MNDNFIFRIIIAISVITFTGWVFLPFVQFVWYPQLIIDITSYDGYGSLVDIPNYIIWAIILLKVIILFGVACYNRTARLLFLVYTLLTLALVAFSGMRAQTSIESFMLDLSNISDGLIIGLAYFSYYRDKF